jgi:glycosyltransferase involved in cell wall biosynthesis
MIDILALSPASFTDVNRAIYKRLADRGWSVEIVIPARLHEGGGMKAANPDRPGDPPVHRLEITHPENSRFAQFVGINELLDRLKPRLVLLDNDPASRMAFSAGRWARGHRARVVCQSCENIPRSVIGDLVGGKLKKAARSAVINSAMGLARFRVDHVFAISNDGTDLWERSSLHDRVSRIPLGFDPAIFHPDSSLRATTREKLGLNQFTIAYFGRINSQKGVHLLIEALGHLKDKPWQFLLDHFASADDPYLKELTAQIDRLGLRDRLVQFEARHSQMGIYMNAADVVVLPSVTTPQWKEQYGRVAPEAMACGKLVLVSDSGALPELVGDAGAVFPENNVPAIAALLRRAMDDDAWRERLSKAAAVRAAEQLSLDRQCELMNDVFVKLLGSGPSRLFSQAAGSTATEA